MGLFRCSNANCVDQASAPLGYDFQAKEPVCPKCGADGRDARTGRFITRLAIIHFEPPHATIAGLGIGHILCAPERKTHQVHDPARYQRTRVLEQMTALPEAVTCPACKAHKDFPAPVDPWADDVPQKGGCGCAK